MSMWTSDVSNEHPVGRESPSDASHPPRSVDLVGDYPFLKAAAN